MEDLHGLQPKNEINFREFFEKYKQKLNNDLKLQTDNDICKALKLSGNVEDDVNFDLLKANCSIDNLKEDTFSGIKTVKFVRGETEVYVVPRAEEFDDLNIELGTYKTMSKWKERYKMNAFTRSNQSYKRAVLPKKKDDEENDTFNDDELIVTVRFYRPTRAIHSGQTLEKPVFKEEFQCLGSNFLVELRDKISCICNGMKFFDISNGPGDGTESKKTDDTNPAYFFIHDTFYNDMRNPANPDYSATIRTWAAQGSVLNTTPYKVADMAETRFTDLTAIIGFPQQYMHHGNCEHIFVISQLEYLPASHFSPTGPSKSLFPYLSSYNVYSSSSCYMCGVRKYCFIVEQSNRQLYDPSYLCKVCYKSFHFIDGKKVGQFRAYQIYRETDNNPRSDDDEQIEAKEEVKNSCTDSDE